MLVESFSLPPEPWAAREEARVVLDSTLMAVREGLDGILHHPLLADLDEDARGTLWIVLAEVLNNIVKHAYAEYPGKIRCRLLREGANIAVEVVDQGLPMPGLQLPEGQLPESAEPCELAEGGFGWCLIRAMTDWMTYDRIGEANQLRFSMECR